MHGSLREPYFKLVKGFGKTGSSTAPGPGATAAGTKASSFAQALWRFVIDPRLEESALIEPMHGLIRDEVAARPCVLLSIQDWSTLSFGNHESKTDRRILTHETDVGYDLATVLMVRGDDGATIAPAIVSMTTADGVLSTRDDPPSADVCHIDQVGDAMQYVRGLQFGVPVVHVIDREADSVRHWRQWNAAGHLALVRGDDRHVLCNGEETTLEAIATRLHQEGAPKDVGPARYKGRPARLYVAEADVVLHRSGSQNVGRNKKRIIPGPPLPLRLVVAEVRDLKGKLLTYWLLLTNVPTSLADAATIARWYYFRWRIEDFHKLMKSSGHQLEDWLQQNGERLFRKLLLAITATVLVWGLERRNDASAEALKALLMQLSGRQTKRGREVTTSGLLAGLWVLQAAVGPLARHGPEELNAMLESHLPMFASREQS